MATPVGSGRWQSVYLGLLNGQPREATEMVTAFLGRPPNQAEAVASLRAAHSLAELGAVELSHRRGRSGPPRVVLTKIPGTLVHPRPLIRYLSDTDAAAAADAQMGHAEWLDRAWRAFARDFRYCEEMAAAATKLMTEAELAADRHQRVGDGDSGSALEARALGVVDPGGD